MNYKKLSEMDERERKSYSKAYMNSVSAINSMNGEVFSGRWSSRYAETLAQAFESVGYYVTIVEIESYDNYAVWVRKNSYSDFFKEGGQVRKLSREDYEGDMAKAQLQKIESYAAKLNEMIHPQDELEAWVQAKLSVVAAYMGDVKHYLDYELQKIGEGEVEVEKIEENKEEEDIWKGPFKEGGSITESHSDQMIDIMNKERESEASKMYRVKPSTMAEDMLEAKEMLGAEQWNKLSREEKKDLVNYLKLKGDIGHFGQEEDIETISGMQYYMAKGGTIDKTKEAFGLLSFDDLESIFDVRLFGLEEEETEKELDSLKEEWYNMKSSERRVILNDFVPDWNKNYAKGGLTTNDKETIKEYEEHVKDNYAKDKEYWQSKKDKEMVKLADDDLSDHLEVISSMKTGHWKNAYNTWRGMDTEPREEITKDAYELLMSKSGMMAKGGISLKKGDEVYIQSAELVPAKYIKKTSKGHQVEITKTVKELGFLRGDIIEWSDGIIPRNRYGL